MQVTGMLHGSQLLQFGGFPTSEVLGPDASEEQIKALIDRHGRSSSSRFSRAASARRARPGSLAAPET